MVFIQGIPNKAARKPCSSYILNSCDLGNSPLMTFRCTERKVREKRVRRKKKEKRQTNLPGNNQYTLERLFFHVLTSGNIKQKFVSCSPLVSTVSPFLKG